jgi:hypothetical protein
LGADGTTTSLLTSVAGRPVFAGVQLTPASVLLNRAELVPA